MSLISVTEGVVLNYTDPLFAVIVMHVLGEKASIFKLGLAGIAFVGAAVVIKPPDLGGGPGALATLASGFFYGLLIAAYKLSIRSVKPARLVLYQSAIASTALMTPSGG